jgi:hypothetical protein
MKIYDIMQDRLRDEETLSTNFTENYDTYFI